jgi:hypothetical protein
LSDGAHIFLPKSLLWCILKKFYGMVYIFSYKKLLFLVYFEGLWNLNVGLLYGSLFGIYFPPV